MWILIPTASFYMWIWSSYIDNNDNFKWSCQNLTSYMTEYESQPWWFLWRLVHCLEPSRHSGNVSSVSPHEHTDFWALRYGWYYVSCYYVMVLKDNSVLMIWYSIQSPKCLNPIVKFNHKHMACFLFNIIKERVVITGLYFWNMLWWPLQSE